MTNAPATETKYQPPNGNPALGVLSRRLLILILTCSASFTLVATAVQLYLTYVQDVEELSESISLIESSYVPALSRSLYELNDVQIDLQMRGALQLTDIVFLQISEDIAGEFTQTTVGSEDYRDLQYHEFELGVDVHGEHFHVGTLVAGSTRDEITNRIISLAFQLLAINATKTFIVAFLLFLIIQQIVTRHIADISNWFDHFSLDELQSDSKLKLNREPIEDELQSVAEAINRMHERIAAEIEAKAELESQSRQLTQDLQQSEKLQAIGELAGGMAHDFNNQLQIILANADLLHDEEDRKVIIESANNIIRSCERTSKFISDLMAVARKDSGQQAEVHVNALLLEIVSVLELATNKKLKVTASLNAENDQILANSTQLQNAFLNLGLNARDAISDGGTITLESKNVFLRKNQFVDGPPENGEYICASFSDTGSGIPKEHIEKIFDRFFTTKPVGEGTGMGLATVLSTVKTHNGLINVQSSEKGSRFDLYFPTIEQIT